MSNDITEQLSLPITARLLREKQDTGNIESYVLVVRKGTARAVLTSADANEDTYFDAASMGKVFVTTPLILKAITTGDLSLSDTLPRFFPDTPPDKAECTIQQLLTHTSGILRVNFPLEYAARTHDEVASFILSTPLGYAPGTNYRYSCNGFILLGFILEKLWGMPLDKTFEHETKQTLGLTRARFNISPDEENAAICWRWAETVDRVLDDENNNVLHGIGGNGGSFWSAADIERFICAVLHRDERLYSRELFDLAETNLTPHFTEGRGLGYLIVDAAYPQTGRLFPVGSFGHTEHTGTSFFVSREKDLYVILLTNATRCANKKNNYRGYNYGDVQSLRTVIHNAVADDLYLPERNSIS